MHPLLQRQLRKCFGSEGPPDGMEPLLEAVNAAYEAADQDRQLLERSMDLTSAELQEGNVALRQHIKELQAVQQRLSHSEAAYRRLIMTANEGMWTIDAEGSITFVNQTMCDVLGCTESEILGRRPQDFVEPGHRGLVPGLDGAGTASERRFEAPLRRKDGSVAWMLVSTSPVSADGGGPTGALQMFADITARKLAEDALREAYASLEQVDAARQAFINSAAHELGTPLTPIRLQVHAMKRLARGDLAKSVEVLERNVDRIILLVSDLLDSVKIQTDRVDVRHDDVDLAGLAQAAVMSFQEVAAQRQLELTLRAPKMVEVSGDRRRLEQVLDNLLSNATKFTPSGGKVTVRVGRDGDLGWFEVSDTGHGIARADLRRLFQPFVQLHQDAHGHGTGLGLYIARSFMHAMGGTLDAQSQGEGQGATFRATLRAVQD